MKRTLAAATFILSALVAPHALAAASPVSATLTLQQDTVLPGVPFDIAVSYKNVSDRPVTIGGSVATLVVTFANGDTVVMHHPDANDQWTIGGSSVVRLAPGESVQQAASWERGSIPNWFRYGSFSGPGTYGIALDLRVFDHREKLLAGIRTPAVPLTRVDPVGIDAELWKRMQQALDGAPWSDNSFAATKQGLSLANEIIQLYPSSGYYPYVLALRAYDKVDKSHIAGLLEAAERFPSSPAHPYLLSAAANCARYAGAVATEAGDMAEAKKYFALAEAKYREASATKSIAIRASTEEGLREIDWRLDRVTKKPVR